MKINTKKPNPNTIMTIEMQITKPTVSEEKKMSVVSSAIGGGLAAIGVLRKCTPIIISGGVILTAGLAGLLHAYMREENE